MRSIVFQNANVIVIAFGIWPAEFLILEPAVDKVTVCIAVITREARRQNCDSAFLSVTVEPELENGAVD
jgi:hypothetical protein